MAVLTVKYFSVADYIQRLKKANFTDEQAQVLAKETEELISSVLDQSKFELGNRDLATKSDIRESELRLQKEIALIESSLVRWAIGIGVTTIITLSGVIFTLLKLMVH